MQEIVKEFAQYFGLFLGYLGLEVFKAAKKWKEDRKKSQKADPVHLARKKNELENHCAVILAETKAAHVGLWRFHNGHFYQGGDSIKNLSLYTEAAITHKLLVDNESQQMPMKNFSKTISELSNAENGYLVLEKDNCPDFYLNQLMADRGYAYMVVKLLRDPERVPVGMLEVSFLFADVNWKNIKSDQLDRYRKELEYKLA